MAYRFSRMQHLLAALVAAPVLAAGVAGCQANPDPAPLPATPSSSMATPTPSTAAPTMPSAANGTGAKAAKAFVRYYFQSVNYAARTGKTSSLEALASEDCVSCAAIVGNIDKVYARGGRIEAEDWHLESIRILQIRPDRTVASIGSHIGREVIVLSDGKKRTHEGGKQPMTMFMRFDSAGPLVTRLDLVTS